jgi:putative addiction module component (TIGR02574 family)
MATMHDKIEQTVLQWAPAERLQLAERLLASVNGFATREIEQAWEAEIARRSEELDSGRVKPVPSRRVFAAARKKLNEFRKISAQRGN